MIRKYKITYTDLLTTILLLAFFFVIWAPTTSNSTLGSDLLKKITRLSYFAFALAIFVLMTFLRKRCYSRQNAAMAVTVVIYQLFHKLWVYGGGGAGSISSMLLCILFCFQTEEVKQNVFRGIKGLLFCMSVIGIVCYLSHVLKLGVPYRLVDYYSNVRHGEWYADYRICYLYINSVQARLCGLFNEPGWFGTFLAFYLCSEDLNFRKKRNVIVLIAGLLTFSLAFLLILAFYFFAKNITSKRIWLWIAVLAGVYLILPWIHTGNAAIDSILSRLTLTKDVAWANARTTSAFDVLFRNTLQDSSVLFGKGAGYSELMSGGGNLSIATYLVDFGIVGTLLLFAPMLLMLLWKAQSHKQAVLFLLCIAISLYQRPWLFEVSNFMLTIGGISLLTDMSGEKTRAPAWDLMPGQAYGS